MPAMRNTRFALTACLLVAAGLLLGAAAPAWPALANPDKDLLALDRLDIFQPGEPSLVYAKNDEPFATLAAEYRIFVPLARIPKVLQQAVLDIEDTQFYEHGAVSIKGMARAALRNITSAKVKEGGSTITQQLVKSLFLSPERTLIRKVKEIQLARDVEQHYSQDKILEMYLNTIYFGGGAYGIEAAARTYFSKSVGQLSLPEAAVLAGLIRAPTALSPFTDPKRARERRDVVLRRMQAVGHLTAAEARSALSTPLTLNPLFKQRGTAPYFVEYLRRGLEPRVGSTALAHGGLAIYTTLDLELQRLAGEMIRTGVKGIEKSVTAKRASAGPTSPAGQAAPGLECAFVVLEPGTGAVRAMIGGMDFARSQFNRVVQARRQPGSAFKPFVYTAALNRGLSPTNLLEDAPVAYDIPQNGHFVQWRPENFDRKFRGPVTVQYAFEESLNVPTVRLLEAVGVDAVTELAQRMGIRTELRRELGLALGVSELTLLDLTAAYGVLANRGVRIPPSGIRRVVHGGEEVLGSSGDTQRILSDDVAFVMTTLMQGAVERGTAKRGRVPGWNIAAKTGTSQDATDLWFIGFTPDLVAGLWIGYDQPRTLGSQETAGRLAAPIWAAFMRRALANLTPQPFAIPEGVMPVLVNLKTGAPTDRNDPDAVTTYVLRGDAGEGLGAGDEPNLPGEISPSTPIPIPSVLGAPTPIAPAPESSPGR